jgi:hypothetical protein
MKTTKKHTNKVIPGIVKGLDAIIQFKTIDIKEMLKEAETAELKASLKEIENLYLKHKFAFDEMGDALLNYHRLNIIFDPIVYIARTRDVKTGIEYFTAKTTWPMKNFKTKDIKIYLGKASDFKGDTQSVKAKDFAISKMRQTLARRMREGEI